MKLSVKEIIRRMIELEVELSLKRYISKCEELSERQKIRLLNRKGGKEECYRNGTYSLESCSPDSSGLLRLR